MKMMRIILSLLIVSCFYNIANSSERLELYFLSERLLSNKVLTFNDAIKFNIKSRSLGFEGITKNKKNDYNKIKIMNTSSKHHSKSDHNYDGTST